MGSSKFGLWPMPYFQDQSLHWNFGSEIKLKNRRCQGWVGGKRTFWIFICLRICSFWLCCGKLWLKWKRSLSWKKKFSAFLQSRGLPCGVKFCSNTSMFYNKKNPTASVFFEAACLSLSSSLSLSQNNWLLLKGRGRAAFRGFASWSSFLAKEQPLQQADRVVTHHLSFTIVLRNKQLL